MPKRGRVARTVSRDRLGEPACWIRTCAPCWAPYASVDLDAAYHQFRQETGQVAYDQFMLYMYPRQRPWYALGRGQARGRWGPPYQDAQGQGILLPCAVGVAGADGAPIAVAGLDVSVAYVASRLLPLDEVPGAWASVLLDGEGRVVVASVGGRVEGGDRVGEPFSVAEVVERVKARRMGTLFVAVDGVDAVAVLAPIGTIGWTYLAWGPESSMLQARGTPAQNRLGRRESR